MYEQERKPLKKSMYEQERKTRVCMNTAESLRFGSSLDPHGHCFWHLSIYLLYLFNNL